MNQPPNEPVPEEKVDVPGVRPQGAMCRAACPQTPCKDGIHPRLYRCGPLPYFDRERKVASCGKVAAYLHSASTSTLHTSEASQVCILTACEFLSCNFVGYSTVVVCREQAFFLVSGA